MTQNEIQNNNIKRKDYTKKLNEINKEIKSEFSVKQSINADMANLENLINEKINQISEIKNT